MPLARTQKQKPCFWERERIAPRGSPGGFGKFAKVNETEGGDTLGQRDGFMRLQGNADSERNLGKFA
jgi:hypothetical protein